MANRLPITLVNGRLRELPSGDQLPAALISGLAAVALSGSAADLLAGVLPDARLSANVPLLSGGALPAVSGANLTALNASNISSGTLADARLSANVPLLSGGALPAVSGANLTSLNASNISSGTVSDARLASTVTKLGNTFNGISQLVQLNASGFLPALNASLLTALNASNISTGTLADARLSANVPLLSGGALPAVSGANLTALNASNISSGTLSDSRLSANVTKLGNTFNGVSQLVQLNGSGFLPALNGSLLTTLNASNISSGTLADARISANVPRLNIANVFTGSAPGSVSTGQVAIGGGVLRAAGSVYLGGGEGIWIWNGAAHTPRLNGDADYTRLYSKDGTAVLYAAPGINYYDNDVHYFRSTGGTFTRAELNTSGFGIGISPTAGSGALQLATHTTQAGGIALGTDTFLHRNGAGLLTLTGSNNSFLYLTSTNGPNLFLGADGANTYVGSIAAHPLYLRTNNTNAISINTSQHCSFASHVGFNGVSAIAKPALNAAATDAATTQALVNQIRAALINYGLCD